MKKLLLISSIIFFYISLLSKAKCQTLVTSYPFNGNANDAVGAANGTVSGATLTSDRFGVANSAYNFNGTTDFIEALADALPTGDNTVSLWFNADVGSVASNRPGLFGYGGNTGPNCPGSSQILIINLSGQGKFTTQAHCLNNYSDYTYPTAPEGNWYNWVVTRSGSTIKMFLNGALISTSNTATNVVKVTGKKLSIGAVVGPDGSSNYSGDPNVGHFKGKIDDIKIYDGAITEAQIINGYLNDVNKAGSGNALSFNGSNNHVEIADNENWNFGSNSFAIETWIKPTNTTSINTILTQSVGGAAGNVSSFYLGLNYNGSGSLSFYTTDGTGWTHSIGTPSGSILADKWQHIVVTRQGGVAAIYINGVSQTISNNLSGITPNIGIAPTIFNGTRAVEIATQNSSIYFQGLMDELRVFNGMGLIQTEIRDWMCKKVTASHPQFSKLVAYFKLDEGLGVITGGFGGNFGALINSPTWQTSGAALGDASAYDYTNATKTANITALTGENFAATSTSGTPAGIHVYRVDTQPNTLSGLAGSIADAKYFGVFQVGGTNPLYQAVHTYQLPVSFPNTSEGNLRLYKRDNNAGTLWNELSATPNTTLKTITVPGQSTEYILGNTAAPLPLTLLSFSGKNSKEGNLLEWKTTDEQNSQFFEIQRSRNGIEFGSIGQVDSKNRKGNNFYNFTDQTHLPEIEVSFYRLKIVDLDGQYRFSKIISIMKTNDYSREKSISIYPNPFVEIITVDSLQKNEIIRIFNTSGQLIKEQKATDSLLNISLSDIAKGAYFIQFENRKKESNKVILKL